MDENIKEYLILDYEDDTHMVLARIEFSWGAMRFRRSREDTAQDLLVVFKALFPRAYYD